MSKWIIGQGGSLCGKIQYPMGQVASQALFDGLRRLLLSRFSSQTSYSRRAFSFVPSSLPSFRGTRRKTSFQFAKSSSIFLPYVSSWVRFAAFSSSDHACSLLPKGILSAQRVHCEIIKPVLVWGIGVLLRSNNLSLGREAEEASKELNEQRFIKWVLLQSIA